jgi:hypothetical protein
MSEQRQLAAAHRIAEDVSSEQDAAERRLRKLRYLIAAVDEEALETWTSLWRQLQGLESMSDAPGLPAGFQPPGGWPRFVERLWLLKHHLDHIQRLCR